MSRKDICTKRVAVQDKKKVVEDGYEFFAKRQLVTLFSAPNYCGEFDNAGGMMSVDETLMCSFQILKPAEKKTKYQYPGGTVGAASPMGGNRPSTPPKGTGPPGPAGFPNSKPKK
ncbi:unnamed protein product [Acanthoscelides obtectus]|uniref:protein-serine/threonine phosphatase n=1 Tax=Acanthoscelides obtectus TaxID=200917 RepID=A0A9P0K050_ACAOB|nr:unnamed protein product [Acanthoscelides obtectus]CAK1646113.1 Serine/threonine-protein phosphatase PP1-beta catalytic subunit [Acanthoscelides obtectus]